MQEADPARNESLKSLLKMASSEDLATTQNVTTSSVTISHSTAVSDSMTFGKIDLVRLPPAVSSDIGSNGETRHYFAPMSTPILSMDHLDLCTPDKKRILIQDLTMQLQEGENLLIVGNSGAGKSSLLRAIAGLWADGNGQITRPADEDVYFLPQRPYCTLGSLRDQLLYPSLQSVGSNTTDYPEGHVESRSHILKQSMSDQALLDILEKVDLGQLAARAGDGDPIQGLEAALDWSNTLSLGEQQRLAFGRVLVNRPRLVIVDEATSALDMVAESRMYSLLREMGQKSLLKNGQMTAPGLTFVSVGHRPSLLAYHDKRLRLNGEDRYTIEKIEKSSLDAETFIVTNL
jgi:ABC-type uncharacterized transport system fused permease/ATPase subunit